jgi:hypothetical protein
VFRHKHPTQRRIILPARPLNPSHIKGSAPIAPRHHLKTRPESKTASAAKSKFGKSSSTPFLSSETLFPKRKTQQTKTGQNL